MDTMDQIARDLAQAAKTKAETHEVLCTERWEQQRTAMVLVQHTIDSIKKSLDTSIGKLPAGIIGVLMGLVGWFAARAFPTP